MSKEHICSSCGRCCQEIAPADYYTEAYKLSEEQKKCLKDERVKYNHIGYGCYMCVAIDDKYYCLIHKLFGNEYKPDNCSWYPTMMPNKLCK